MQIYLPDFMWEMPNLSNQTVLEISFFLFTAFCIDEFIGAYYSDALTLLGDAVSMSVDVLSYVGNIYVEWFKSQYGRVGRRHRMTVDFIIPLVSVLSLIGVTIYITIDAMRIIRHPPKRDLVNVTYLYTFSLVN